MAIDVQQSEIHGKGLFAKRRFRKGEHIGTFEGRKARKDGPHVLWVDEGEDWFPLLVTNDLKYANHSLKPNAEIDGRDLRAARAIPAGTEITIHYGEDWED